jgi:hypothetical protein
MPTEGKKLGKEGERGMKSTAYWYRKRKKRNGGDREILRV